MQQLILESRLRIESHKVSGIALIPRVSRNLNLYLPEELKRGDGMTVPLNWEHQTQKRSIGTVTFHYDQDLQQLRYEGTITDDTAYEIVKNHTYHVSIGAEPTSIKSVCGEERCYNLPQGIHFKELSIVATPGIPESTLNLIESYFNDSPLIHENCTKCDCTESGLSPHSADRPDSDFAYVPSGGNKSDRKFPIYDAPHVRNALARYSQADLPSDQKSKVYGRICSAAKKFGVDSDACSKKEGSLFDDSIDGGDSRIYQQQKPNIPSDLGDGQLTRDGPKTMIGIAAHTDDNTYSLIKNLAQRVEALEKNHVISPTPHVFKPWKEDEDMCSVCGGKENSPQHIGTPLYNQKDDKNAETIIHNETCKTCGGLVKKVETCTKCGGIKK